MLHKINPAEGYDRLEKIVEFERKLLAFVGDPNTLLPLTEPVIRAAFTDEGGWLWKKVKRADSRMKKLLEDLITHCQDHPGVGKQINDAFANDITFDKNIEDPQFRFQYPQLSAATQALLSELMIYFYENLFDDGFPEWIDANNEKYSRKAFVRAFRKANKNLGVCPACDGDSPSEIDGNPLDDTDHFLPKSIYPFYSVHPFNLVPLCLECNERVKKATDPIDDPLDEPLINSFHPYLRPAIENVKVLVKEESFGNLLVSIEDNTNHPSRRVQSLDRVFLLEGRWKGRLEKVRKQIVGLILHDGRMLKARNEAPDSKELEASLKDHLTDREQAKGVYERYVLQESYLKYALTTPEEFDELLTSFLNA
jgi:hypothetical protein